MSRLFQYVICWGQKIFRPNKARSTNPHQRHFFLDRFSIFGVA